MQSRVLGSLETKFILLFCVFDSIMQLKMDLLNSSDLYLVLFIYEDDQAELSWSLIVPNP